VVLALFRSPGPSAGLHPGTRSPLAVAVDRPPPHRAARPGV